MKWTRRQRRGFASVATLLVHLLLLWVVQRAEVRPHFHQKPSVVVEVTALPPAAPPAPRESQPPPSPPSPHQPQTKAGVAPAPPPSSAQAPAIPPPESSPPAPSGPSLLRRSTEQGLLERVVSGGGPLSPSLQDLEGALDVRVEGPRSDAARAAAGALEHLHADLAGDAVSAGLADDYFRALQEHVETAWRPEVTQLNDGGESVSQLGMMRDFVEERGAWDEMWRAYLDLAKQYAQGTRPSLPPKRIEQLRELMRSRKGSFRVHAISEVKLTQSPDGKLLALEMPLPSGHPGVDEGVRAAFVQALLAMSDKPPERVHRGHSVSSWWRLRATWIMIPPTALLTGAGFDITSKGFTMDVPFDIKLQTAVLLQRTDAQRRRP